MTVGQPAWRLNDLLHITRLILEPLSVYLDLPSRVYGNFVHPSISGPSDCTIPGLSSLLKMPIVPQKEHYLFFFLFRLRKTEAYATTPVVQFDPISSRPKNCTV